MSRLDEKTNVYRVWYDNHTRWTLTAKQEETNDESEQLTLGEVIEAVLDLDYYLKRWKPTIGKEILSAMSWEGVTSPRKDPRRQHRYERLPMIYHMMDATDYKEWDREKKLKEFSKKLQKTVDKYK